MNTLSTLRSQEYIDIFEKKTFIDFLKAHLEWEMGWQKHAISSEDMERVINYYNENKELFDHIDDYNERLGEIYEKFIK